MARAEDGGLAVAERPPAGASDGAPPRQRAEGWRRVLAELSGLEGVRGGVMVTPDGLVITSSLPAPFPVESLAALGATLGRELELGTDRLGRGGFRMASFTATEGTLFIGGSPIGFLILVGEHGADPAGVRRGLGHALARLA